MEAVATKSAVASSEMSTIDARCGLYDFIRLPVMSRICIIPAWVPRAWRNKVNVRI